MKRLLIIGGCLLAAVLALTPQIVSAHQAQGPDVLVRKISGTVGPAMTISMARARTHTGRYVITIHDESALHNFHLTGPNGVDKATGVAFVGTVKWHVRLVKGTYTFQCDVHPLTMNGTLVAHR